jgi:hypothetical protein
MNQRSDCGDPPVGSTVAWIKPAATLLPPPGLAYPCISLFFHTSFLAPDRIPHFLGVLHVALANRRSAIGARDVDLVEGFVLSMSPAVELAGGRG